MNSSYYMNSLNWEEDTLFQVLFDRYYLQLCRFAAKYLSESEGQEDVVQDAFAKLWQQRLYFKKQKIVRNFLYVTVRNQCLNICKHRKVIKKYISYTSKEKFKERYSKSEDIRKKRIDKIHIALQELPESCKLIMRMGYIQGMKNKEIAEDLYISVNTVKTQKKRGIKKLRYLLLEDPKLI